jgi:hypothetical protein
MTKSRSVSIEAITHQIAEGGIGSLYLVVGDRVLAEPGAIRIGEALASKVGCEVAVYRRPAGLGALLADLKTYSLFASAKVLVAVETAVLADAQAAAHLLDEALESCPIAVDASAELSEPQRRSASRLLQTLRLFQIAPHAGSAEEVIANLPDSALQGAVGSSGRRRRRGRKQIAEAREHLVGLLEVARLAEIEGWAETDLGDLAEIAERGLPEGHALILAESTAAAGHPLVQKVAEAGRYAAVGQVEATKSGGWQGLDLLAAELGQETGASIDGRALEELARRTLQKSQTRGGSASVSAESTARFAGEFRKLATLVGQGEIGLELVRNVVEDRGEEDAWKTLDAIGAGRADEALRRIDRLMSAAEDPIATRLSFFALLAGFARQLTALSNLIDLLQIPRQSMPYARFKAQLAPRLQAELPGGKQNPMAGLHPYRLYRAYLVACRVPAERVGRLPARVLETELQLKGESDQPDAALAALVCDIATAARGR